MRTWLGLFAAALFLSLGAELAQAQAIIIPEADMPATLPRNAMRSRDTRLRLKGFDFIDAFDVGGLLIPTPQPPFPAGTFFNLPDGNVSIGELLGGLQARNPGISVGQVNNIFSLLDTDQDGFITTGDF